MQQTTGNNDAYHYVQQLIAQQVAPPNEFAADLVGQIRRAEQEVVTLLPQLERAQNEVEQLRTRRIALTSISRQLGMTLARWREQEVAKQAANVVGDIEKR